MKKPPIASTTGGKKVGDLAVSEAVKLLHIGALG
jgi:hypothetical protein